MFTDKVKRMNKATIRARLKEKGWVVKDIVKAPPGPLQEHMDCSWYVSIGIRGCSDSFLEKVKSIKVPGAKFMGGVILGYDVAAVMEFIRKMPHRETLL